ncbi:hypothetical protein TNCV_1066571 [Trichonephila clavipes]|uniref:Uncharacterized protein n=1 Tax=Trichonephila clavipes TaxID=2585209 RepID=A0A8X6R4G3_TRICX|nr:hypothetical protein TNCV_1066571 [Trichonephila clavipes]
MVPAQVSSTSLDHGSKLRGPSPNALDLTRGLEGYLEYPHAEKALYFYKLHAFIGFEPRPYGKEDSFTNPHTRWAARSCDLTPLDYFLWGYVKSLDYADKPQTLDHLEDNIRRVIADIRPQMLENSLKIGLPDWTTSEPAVAVICQKSYLKCIATRLSFE